MQLERTNEQGFALLEALVAAAIFAAVLGALYGGLGVGWRAWGQAGDEEAALAVARSQLALAGIETPLAAGSHSGISSGIAWESSISPYGNVQERQSGGIVGYWVRVNVHWSERGRAKNERNLSLTSLKLVRPMSEARP